MVPDAPTEVDPVVESYKEGIDQTLLARNLKLSSEERLLQLMELQRFALELRHAGQAIQPTPKPASK